MNSLQQPSKFTTHIAIIGAGMVGSTIAYACMLKNLASKITLVDINQKRANGEVLDLAHGIWSSDVGAIVSGDYGDCKDADIVVITAGATQRQGESRLELTTKNSAILREIIRGLGNLQPDCKVIVVSNPVDVLTTIAKNELPLPPNQIMGSGTYLDTLRLRHGLGQKLSVHPTNIHAYMLGEHGDSSFANWDSSTVGGRLVNELLNQTALTEIEAYTRGAAYSIIEAKGATYYGISVAVSQIITAILQNKNELIPVSTIPGDYYGITNVCLGIPAVINSGGIAQVWNLNLSPTELAQLKESATKVNQAYLSI